MPLYSYGTFDPSLPHRKSMVSEVKLYHNSKLYELIMYNTQFVSLGTVHIVFGELNVERGVADHNYTNTNFAYNKWGFSIPLLLCV